MKTNVGDRRSVDRRFKLALGVLILFNLLRPSYAQAFPYFNGEDGFGFDNSVLGLAVAYEIDSESPGFLSIGGPGSGNDVIVETSETNLDAQEPNPG